MSSKSSRIPRKIALCYIRLSYTKNESDRLSPERQRGNIQAICDRNDWIPEWYEDADGHKSGRKVKNRPGWLSLEKRLKDPDVVALVANDSSRMHRKFWRVGYLLDLLDEIGVRLVFAAYGGREIDTSNPNDRMMVVNQAVHDEAQANDIAIKAKDSIMWRKSQGKTVGMPPFGTMRDDSGYLVPSPEGAWLLPDGSWLPGLEDDDPPESDALWRGYYDCARRILELYAENQHGRERIGYQVIDEGWAFRDREGQPRSINKDDIRRVTSNWPQYAGLSPEGKAKDVNASLEDDLVGMLYDTGRQVFPLELLRRVAQVHQARSVTTRPPGGTRESHPYPLTRLLYCAHCERLADEHNNPQYRSRISGANQKGKLRYRHAEGVKCGCQRRSVFTHVIEDDFGRLIKLLTVDEDKLPLMIEWAVQSESGGIDDDDFEEQKRAAIAKCRRRIDNARFLLLEGDISKEEYLRRKDHNERHIAHWEARTTETEKAAIELAMCMDALENLADLWDTADDEDKQHMARVLFEYVTYDFDRQQIVDFRLKPWADRYLVLRASLYGDDESLPDEIDESGDFEGDVTGEQTDEKQNRSCLKTTNDLCPIGDFGARNVRGLISVSEAVKFILEKLNSLPSLPDPTLTTRERNIIIRARYAAGVSQADLARQFEISYQRVHQIVHGRRK